MICCPGASFELPARVSVRKSQAVQLELGGIRHRRWKQMRCFSALPLASCIVRMLRFWHRYGVYNNNSHEIGCNNTKTTATSDNIGYSHSNQSSRRSGQSRNCTLHWRSKESQYPGLIGQSSNNMILEDSIRGPKRAPRIRLSVNLGDHPFPR